MTDFKQMAERLQDMAQNGLRQGGEECAFLASVAAALSAISAEPVATVSAHDTEDEREGVRFSLADWARLNALPAGTKLYASPVPQLANPVSVVPEDVRLAVERMSQPLHESWLKGVTAEMDARCMRLISEFIKSLTAPPVAQPEQAAQVKENAASLTSDGAGVKEVAGVPEGPNPVILVEAIAEFVEDNWDQPDIAQAIRAEFHKIIAPAAPSVASERDAVDDSDLVEIVRTICNVAAYLRDMDDAKREHYPSPISEGSPLLIAARKACLKRGFTADGLAIAASEKEKP